MKAAEERPFFERREVVPGVSTRPLSDYLPERLQRWRWPVMLETGGIRVVRGGVPVAPLTLATEVKGGDLLVIDDTHANTWQRLMQTAHRDAVNYVFCPQRANDSYLLNKVRALLASGGHVDTLGAVPGIPHLYALAESLLRIADRPIRHIVLVSHANEFGDIVIPLRERRSSDPATVDPDPPPYVVIQWELLAEAIDEGKGKGMRLDARHLLADVDAGRMAAGERVFSPTVLPRPTGADGKFLPFGIIIRGCQAGMHTILLDKVREAFGPMVDVVVMPRYYDAADTLRGDPVEYFMHNFVVSSKTPLTRAQVVQRFQEAQFADWLGNEVPRDRWSAWVPSDVNARKAEGPGIEVTVEGFTGHPTLHARWEKVPLAMNTMLMPQQQKPTPAEIRDAFTAALERRGYFKTGEGAWPVWERFGLASKDAFIDFWTYELDPDMTSSAGNWYVRGMRHWYLIRTPLTENGTLIANYYPSQDGARPSIKIDYNDRRIFGWSTPHGRKNFAERL